MRSIINVTQRIQTSKIYYFLRKKNNKWLPKHIQCYTLRMSKLIIKTSTLQTKKVRINSICFANKQQEIRKMELYIVVKLVMSEIF